MTDFIVQFENDNLHAPCVYYLEIGLSTILIYYMHDNVF